MGAEPIEQGPRDETQLVQAAQEGDRPAFAALVDAYWGRLFRWLYHLTHDRHLAEDLVQESFLKAFRALASFRAGTNFQAWLFRIAYNNFVNQWRAADRARQAFPNHLPNAQEGPVEQLLSREALQTLIRAMARLPVEFRAALLLRVEEDLSFKQIAEVLDLTEETARWRVFKARQKLMGQLAPRLEPEKP